MPAIFQSCTRALPFMIHDSQDAKTCRWLYAINIIIWILSVTMASLCTRIQVYPDVWRPSPRKRCKNGSGHLSKCGCRCNGSLCWPWILFLFGAPPPTHETMPKLIRAPFQMRLQLKQDYILATYIMLVWRPPPETMQKWIRATFQMWLQLQREFIWATDLVLVWRPPPRKRCQNGSGHILKCGSRWSGTLFWPPERDECACLRVCMYV